MTPTLLGVLLESSVRALAVAALVGAVLFALRLRTGAVRHAAWAAVLLAMLAMPWLPRLVPSVAVPVPAALPVIHEIVDVPITQVSPAPTPMARSLPTSAAAPATPPDVSASTAWPEWPQVAGVVYVCGVLVFAGRLFAGMVSLRRLRAASHAVSLDGMAVPVDSTPDVAVPMTTGIFRPRIVLPSDWTTWPADKFAAVIAHERAHVERRDPLVLWLARINRCVFWFHPLAWWLERELARTAEQACDAAAVRATGEPRRYAEVLIEMAEAVRKSHGRLVWHGVGIDGVGMLGGRIDRILSGDVTRPVSRARKSIVAALCALSITVGVACQRAKAPAALVEDPEVAKRLAQQKADSDLWAAARQMTAADVTAAERALDANPGDFALRKKLLWFYFQSGQKVLGWNEMVERRRPRLLWVIEHHPEHELASWRGLSARYDPVGYAQAKRLWTGHVAKPNASSRILYNAATFFQTSDKPTAEAILLRARETDPNGPQPRSQNGFSYSSWARRLGILYALAILGSDDEVLGSVPKSLSTSEANGPFAMAVRRKLETSNDPEILYATGVYLVRNGSQAKVAFDHQALGRTYLERAAALGSSNATRQLVSLGESERNQGKRAMLRSKQAELVGGAVVEKVRTGQRFLTRDEQRALDDVQPQAIAAMTEEYRFTELPQLADGQYMRAEGLAYTDKNIGPGAAAAYARSKRYAQDALALAPKFASHPSHAEVVHRATIALAAHALREGDREQAVEYMNEAAKTIPSASSELGTLQSRLVNYLLDVGERESVAAYLTRVAAGYPDSRDQMLADAAAIRAGRMPMGYQYMKTPR